MATGLKKQFHCEITDSDFLVVSKDLTGGTTRLPIEFWVDNRKVSHPLFLSAGTVRDLINTLNEQLREME